MKLNHRLKKLEKQKAPTYSPEKQREMLDAFIEIETLFNGRPPTAAEIDAERERLAQPLKKPTKNDLQAIAEEVESMIYRHGTERKESE